MKKGIWLNENEFYEINETKIKKAKMKNKDKDNKKEKERINEMISNSKARIEILILLLTFFCWIFYFSVDSMANNLFPFGDGFNIVVAHCFSSGIFMIFSIVLYIPTELLFLFSNKELSIQDVEKAQDKYSFIREQMIAFKYLSIFILIISIAIKGFEINIYREMRLFYAGVLLYLWFTLILIPIIKYSIMKGKHKNITNSKYLTAAIIYLCLFCAILFVQCSPQASKDESLTSSTHVEEVFSINNSHSLQKNIMFYISRIL